MPGTALRFMRLGALLQDLDAAATNLLTCSAPPDGDPIAHSAAQHVSDLIEQVTITLEEALAE